ncbi:hypothetical protein Clo1100_1780 [Clostridium sp. BNL1100]|nr:hypothetical protein Clo1100_1780 [Clostridium sp. BNL1100]
MSDFYGIEVVMLILFAIFYLKSLIVKNQNKKR